jgi:hypothetical protein
MPQGQFELAVGLVMAHHPGLQAYDDVGFDLDALDALTLRQMQVSGAAWRACRAGKGRRARRGCGGSVVPQSAVIGQAEGATALAQSAAKLPPLLPAELCARL